MFGRKRKPLKEELPEKVARRAKMIPTPDLLDWAENALYAAHRNLSAYRARPEGPDSPMYFSEARQSTEALLAVLRELESTKTPQKVDARRRKAILAQPRYTRPY